jgi:hypothetical protein
MNWIGLRFFIVCAFLHRLVVAVDKTRELPRGHGGEGSFAADKTHLAQLDEWTGTKSKHNSRGFVVFSRLPVDRPAIRYSRCCHTPANKTVNVDELLLPAVQAEVGSPPAARYPTFHPSFLSPRGGSDGKSADGRWRGRHPKHKAHAPC